MNLARPALQSNNYYTASAVPPAPRPPLRGDARADVCIVGAGYTGLSTALELSLRGYRVVVLEAAEVGWGASGRNGGQIVHSYSRDIDVIASRYGDAVAQPLARMAFEGAEIIRERVRQYDLACDLHDGGLFAAITPRQMKHLAQQQALWQKWAHPGGLQLLDHHEVRQHVNSDRYIGAMYDPAGGHLHPLKLAHGQAQVVERLGGRIHEHSRVLKIDRSTPVKVHTATGCVDADFVVIACNAYIGALEPSLLQRSMPCGTQIVATEPLGDRAKALLPTNHCVEDCNFLLDYFRLSADHRLLYGGGVVYGARDPWDIEAKVRPKLLKTFPQLADVRIDYAWTGNFQLTLSRLPDVGRLSPHIYYSHGCSGHGVTFTHLIGRVLAQAIAGQAERFDAFERLPHHPFPGGRMLRVPFTALGAFYYQMRDALGW